MGEDISDNPEHFDPQADPKERLRVRYEYRELISATQKNKEDFIKPDNKGLHKALDQGEELFSRVKQTREAVLDSHFLVVSSNLGAQQVQQLQTHLVKFERDVFAAKLITFMGGRNALANRTNNDDDEDEGVSSRRRHEVPNLDWAKLGKKVTPYFRRTPTLTFMFGPLATAPPARRERKAPTKHDKPDASQKVVPSQLDKVESQEEATTGEVKRVYTCLVKATTDSSGNVQPICLFKFIINPQCFGQTVENIFHLSFLVKDGRAKIDVDADTRLPLVSPTEPYKEQQGNQVVKRKQVVMHMTIEEYQEIIRVFNIKKAMIPTRPRIQPGTSGLANGMVNGVGGDHNGAGSN